MGTSSATSLTQVYATQIDEETRDSFVLRSTLIYKSSLTSILFDTGATISFILYTFFLMVLWMLRDHKFYAKLSKCEFWLMEVKFLGHKLTIDGVFVYPSRIEVVVAWHSRRTYLRYLDFWDSWATADDLLKIF